MENELLTNLKVILQDKGFKVPSDSVLNQEIDNAIFTINECRRFTPTIEKPYPKKYKSLIIPMCVSAISKYGAEGETSHSENGINRTYSSADDYPKEILMKITPLVK